jgi:hypothetical protein
MGDAMDSLVLTAALIAAAYVVFVVGVLFTLRTGRGRGGGGGPPAPPEPPWPSDFDLWESELERTAAV